MDILAVVLSSLTLVWTGISFFLLHKQSKELQTRQSNIDVMNHAKGILLNTEIELYKRLSLKLNKTMQDMYYLFPERKIVAYFNTPKDKNEHYNNSIKKALDSYNDLLEEFFASRPFIDETIYKNIDVCLSLFVLHIQNYRALYIDGFQDDLLDELEVLKKCYETNSKIEKTVYNVMKNIKKYLNV